MITCVVCILAIFNLPVHKFQRVLAAELQVLDIYQHPSAYLLALSSDDVSDFTDSPSEASEAVEYKVKYGKVLRPPMAFSLITKDQKTSATKVHQGTTSEQENESNADNIKEDGTQNIVHAQKNDEKYEQGAGKLHTSEHAEKHAEKGDKKYESEHSSEKFKKGHHKEQDHVKSYTDKGANKEEHHSDDDHFKEHEKGEDGEKKSKYSEKGDFKKGHSTKGEHVIHKLDEYEKKHEFYDEDHDEEDVEKDGGFHEEHGHKKVKKEKGNLEKHNFHYDIHGKKSNSGKGITYKDDKGHDKSGGHKSNYEVTENHGDKEGKDDRWKWTFRKTIGRKPHHKSQYKVPTKGAYFRVKIQESSKKV